MNNQEKQINELSFTIFNLASLYKDAVNDLALAISSIDNEYKTWIYEMVEKYNISIEDAEKLIGVGNSCRRLIKDCEERRDKLLKDSPAFKNTGR